MFKRRETKIYGSIRKSKRYGTCGVILSMSALALLSTGYVKADEKTTATENKQEQLAPTPQATDSQNKAKQTTGSLEVTVPNQNLKNEVEKAKQAGLTVQETTVDKGTATSPQDLEAKQKEIEVSYDTQTSALDKTTEKYKQDKAQRDKEISDVTAKNKKLQDDVDSENAKRTAENEKIELKNKVEKANYDKELASLKSKGTLAQSADGKIKVYGNFDESKRNSPQYYGKLSASFEVVEGVKLVNGALGANPNTKLELADGLKKYRNVGHSDKEVYSYGGEFITGFKKGSSFTLKNVGKTKEGEIINARFEVLSDPKAELPASLTAKFPPRIWLWWNKGQAISPIYFNPKNYLNPEFKISYFDNDNKPINLGIVNTVYDIDYGQSVRMEYGDNGDTGLVINPKGSQVRAETMPSNGKQGYKGYYTSDGGNSDNYPYDNSKGYHVYANGGFNGLDWNAKGDPAYADVNDEKSTPLGSIISIGYGTNHRLMYYAGKKHFSSYTESDVEAHRKRNPNSSDLELFGNMGYAFQLWGLNAISKELILIHIPPIPLLPPPKLDEVPKPIIPPTIEVTYNTLRTTPQIEKHVKNADDQDIHDKSVAKQSTVKWELETKPLPKNREKVEVYEITDYLPKGFVLDLDQSIQESQGYGLTYDKVSHAVTITATQAIIQGMNADLSKVYPVKAPVLIGKVLNDGAVYTNNFRLNINNKYQVYSNTVKTTTPENPKPIKHNYNKDKVLIDGKQVLAGSTNYYNITLDYDQYKGIKADKETILKGFGGIDDYPEDVLTVDTKDLQFVDSDGQAVTGLSVYHYQSLEAIDNEKVKEYVSNSTIKPKGAFLVFLADNPEEYFTKYIQTGKSVTLIAPMKVKEEFAKTGGKYENTAYQIDFGNGYVTETIVNNVPKLESKKDVVINGNETVDGQKIELGKSFSYNLVGALIPKDRADDLFDYSFIDDYMESHDKYDNVFRVLAKVDFKTLDGKEFKAGQDLSEYVTHIHDEKAGKIIISFKEDFLKSISKESDFQAEAFLDMERIKDGEVENTFINTVNGVEVVSNTVKTTTPKPPKPSTPQLPNTGTESSILPLVSGLLGLVGSFSLVFKKKEN